MIDLHCHYLPGIDDGPETLDEALDLARAAVADGITEAVLTPHVHPGRYENTRSSLQAVFDGYRAALQAAAIPLHVRLGGEVRLLPESLELLTRGDMPLLGKWATESVVGQVALIEFPHEQIPVGALQAIRWLRQRGVVPLIAHPERNKGVMRDPQRLVPFLQEGCLLQITAASVAGLFGTQCEQLSHGMIQAGWATVVASDAHNLTSRPPVMTQARQVLAQRHGEAVARRLTVDNPLAIVAGEQAAAVAA